MATFKPCILSHHGDLQTLYSLTSWRPSNPVFSHIMATFKPCILSHHGDLQTLYSLTWRPSTPVFSHIMATFKPCILSHHGDLQTLYSLTSWRPSNPVFSHIMATFSLTGLDVRVLCDVIMYIFVYSMIKCKEFMMYVSGVFAGVCFCRFYFTCTSENHQSTHLSMSSIYLWNVNRSRQVLRI